MINNDFVKLLVRKIQNQEINPNTNLPFSISDIKKDEYRIMIEKLLSEKGVE